MSAISNPPLFLNTQLITDTRVNSLGVIPMKHMEGLIDNTTGSASNIIMGGVITDTTRGVKPSSIHVPPIRVKTKAKRLGQVPYAGKMY